jgi:hypothetical protein
MKIRYLITCCCFLFATRLVFAGAVPEQMQLFLLIGQSNMAGRGKLEAREEATNPRIFMLTKEREWVLAKDPLHFDKPVAGVGPGLEFARTLVSADPNITVGLIPCAVGGTSLDKWKVGGELYAAAVARTREAMKCGKLAGILWHQGESDKTHEQLMTYGDRFAAMIGQLRKDLDAGDVPVVMGELGRFRPAHTGFNAALPDISRRVPLCTYVTSEDLADRGDRLHFDAPSQRIFGQRYAAGFLRLKAQATAK